MIKKLITIVGLIEHGCITKEQARLLMDMPDLDIVRYVICNICGNHDVDLWGEKLSCNEWIIKGIIE